MVRSRQRDWFCRPAKLVKFILTLTACLVTLVDRKSGLLIGGKSPKKASAQVSKVMIRALRHQPLHTVTPDRGKEFAAHAAVTEALGVEFYFASPHHPWERGTNENTNGLIRQFFPKGTSFLDVTDDEVARMQDLMNGRPRETLGWHTPAEVLNMELAKAVAMTV